MSELSHGQHIALDYHLTDYPDDLSFIDICEMLEEHDNEHKNLTICDVFCDWDTEYLIDMMKRLADEIDRVIVDSHKNPEGK